MTSPHGIRIEIATAEDFAHLVNTMREEDRKEIAMSGNYTSPEMAVVWGAACSEMVMTMKAQTGELLCVYGVNKVARNPSIMSMWALGTTALRKHAKAFIRATPDAFRVISDLFPQVQLYVNGMPTSYTTYRKWAEKHLGAQFSPESFTTAANESFTSFAIWKGESPCVPQPS